MGRELAKKFDWFDDNPNEPDSEFQKLAQFTKYSFPIYRQPDPHFDETMADAMTDIVTDPDLKEFFVARIAGTKPDRADAEKFFGLLASKPKAMRNVILAFIRSGKFPL